MLNELLRFKLPSKMVPRSKRKLTLALTFLMVLIGPTTISGCAVGAPPVPEITVYQPIIDQSFCDPSGANCVTKSLCREYYRDKNTGEFVFVKDDDFKLCHGIFGVDAANYVKLKAYTDAVTLWVTGLLNQINNLKADQ
jgi:hypothetical protein